MALAAAGAGLATLCVVLVLVLLVRLDGARPLAVTGLARDLLPWLAPASARLRFDRATIAWALLTRGPEAAFVVALDAARIGDAADADGWPVGGPAGVRVRGTMGALRVGLRTPALLAGRFVPVSVSASDAALVVSPAVPPPPPPVPVPAPGPPPPPPPGGRAGPPFAGPGWAALARVDLRNVSLRWTGVRPFRATVETAAAERAASGDPWARATVVLAPRGGPPAMVRVAITPRGTAADRGALGASVAVQVARTTPARYAALVPALAALDLPVGLTLAATLDAGWRPEAARVEATFGAGRVLANAVPTSGGGFAWPVAGGSLAASIDPATGARLAPDDVRLTLRRLVLRLVPAASPATSGPSPSEEPTAEKPTAETPALAAPVITASGTLAGQAGPGGRLAGALRVTLPSLPVADLDRDWPPSVARGGRRWVTANITGGGVSTLAVSVGLASADGLAGLGVARVSGGFDAAGLAVHWLRPIPPITGAAGHVAFVDLDTLRITLSAGRQGPLDVSGTTMRITGLSAPDQIGHVVARIRGPLPAVLAVLGEPRLHLLSKRPLSFTDPRGTVDGTLAVSVPLDDRVTIDEVALRADIQLAHVHLGHVAAGLSLDDGRFRLRADTDGLSLAGTATVVRIPVTLSLGMDFRAGPPTALAERATVRGDVTADALANAGVPVRGLFGGTARLALAYRLQRGGDATLDLDADLDEASVGTPVGWHKEAGEPADARATLTLRHDRLVAVDRLEAHGPGLSIRGHAEVSDGRVRAMAFEHVAIGGTEASGIIRFPRPGRPAIGVAFRGAVLDLGWLGPVLSPPAPPSPGEAASPPPAGSPGPPWGADLRFGRVLLPDRRVFLGVVAVGRGAGVRPAEGRIAANGPAPLSIVLRPGRAGRRLTVDAGDTGALLAGLDVTDRIVGGRLALQGRFADGAPGDPFVGRVTVSDFTIRRVPWIARLLRDATIYGLLDRAPRDSLSITRLEAPVRLARRVLTITDARLFQAALGATATGTIGIDTGALDLRGTVVPAYAVNALPGRLPLVGRLLSPEKGGGLFAATWRVTGSARHPRVSVNPLAALVPGVLRNLLSR